MNTLQELSQILDTLLYSTTGGDYCPNGLQVEGKKEIRKVAFAVSASLATIRAAVEEGVDALIVHHGIFWDAERRSTITGIKKDKVALLLASGISLFAYHLPLDAQREFGNNWKAARDLGWSCLEPFGDVGVRGEFASVEVAQFQEKLEGYYSHPAAVALGGKKRISSAALISGGAYRSLELAARAGVDAFITGNYDEPAWDIAHEWGIHFFALGHYATERIGVKALQQHFEENLKISAIFLDFPNPF